MVRSSLKLMGIELQTKNGFGRRHQFQTFEEANRFLQNCNIQLENMAYEYISYHVAWEEGHCFAGSLRLPFDREEDLLLQNLIRDILYDRLYLVFPSRSLHWLTEYILRIPTKQQEYDVLLSRGEGFDHEQHKMLCVSAEQYVQGLYKTYPGLQRICKKARRFFAFCRSIEYRSMNFKNYLLQLAKKYVRMSVSACLIGDRRQEKAYLHRLVRLSQEVHEDRLIRDERFTRHGMSLYGLLLGGEEPCERALSDAELRDFSYRMRAVKSIGSYHKTASYERDLFYLVYAETLDRILQEADHTRIYRRISEDVVQGLIAYNIPICRVIECIDQYDPFAVGRQDYGREVFHKVYPEAVIKPSIAV